ncbi:MULTISPECIES: malonate decarboxylase holo-ACP synthase [unclassified Caballeronia]|uniref:malonate decarboxylase holo-ACP synthase n=1 Tax=unclassified Caballeronia TaxID=2646786 RepID=UPI002854B504|nr:MULTISPECIES: malonate decarboxylase holo-ACP synthase [unclassified Caballeronia]MDR5740945.1 malonate decarboxylase holo-ACP synthase [Caballeronia sp. LZ016]MDR5806843.1 malonate decarboxylase holo-ACP synthase [Caballeronia sp. LZ019]
MSIHREAPRPHDLVWVEAPEDIVATSAMPAWATREWLSVAPAVVRREAAERGVVPVGLRGHARNERFAAFVNVERIARCVTPEALARARGWLDADGALANLPCMRALAFIAPRLDALALTWGVTGSVGFALASGVSTLREDSDLDLLLRADRPLPRDDARALLSLLQAAPARIDMQVDTGHGGFALAEWTGRAGRVMLKTGRGPKLVADPWTS